MNKHLIFKILQCGGIILCLHIAKSSGWITEAQTLITNISTMDMQLVLQYLPALCSIAIFMALIQLVITSYNMGRFDALVVNDMSLPRLTSLEPALLQSKEITNADPQQDAAQTNQYQQIRLHYQKELMRQEMQILDAVKAYVLQVLSPYMKETDLLVLCNNIEKWQASKKSTLFPAITNGALTTLDLRHLVWNIGERLKWKGEQRAIFIKHTFPHEFRDMEIHSIRRNLREQGTCIIKLDDPLPNSYDFHLPPGSVNESPRLELRN